MQKRTLLAVVLSIIVVLVFSYLEQPPTPPEDGSESSPRVQSDTTPEPPPQLRADTPAEVSRAPSTDTARSGSTEMSPVPSTETRTVQTGDTIPFETGSLIGSFSRRGARVESVRLKQYYRFDRPGELFDLVKEDGKGLHFELRYPQRVLDNASFERVVTEDTRTFHFRVSLNNGLVVDKRYQFSARHPYQVNHTVSIRNQSDRTQVLEGIDFPTGRGGVGSASLRWGPGFGQSRAEKTQFDQVYWYYGKNGDMEYLSPTGAGGFWGMFTGGGEKKDHQLVRGPVEWSAVSNRYFIAAVVPRDQPFNMLFLNTEDGGDTFTAWSGHATRSIQPGQRLEFGYDLYLGPKEYSALQEFHPGLEGTLNYGWFTVLTLPLLWGLHIIYAVIPNYGIAIIILSLLIKVILYPLTKKGLVSMQKMRELQPKIKELQKKYKDDKQKLNQKLMEFYQEHDMNSVGGCFPMLLQLPIFFALYRMLEYSIELRGAPFFLWVNDLSAKDPYYILPVVMGILMFFQQKYTMSMGSTAGAMGSQQQMMMYVMPVVFVFLFMNFPVGLVLYWMTNSVATIVQYWLIHRSMETSS